MNTWQFWTGTKQTWVGLCQQTVQKHCPNVVLLDEAAWQKLWTEDRDIDLGRLYIAHKADFIRAYLLAHHGGMWVDSDCLFMRDIHPLLEVTKLWDFCGYRESSGQVTNNFMIAPLGSVLMDRYYKKVCKILREHQAANRKLDWLTIGANALSSVVDGRDRPWLRLDRELIQPICWSQPGRYFNTGTAEEHAKNEYPHAFCHMLSGHMVNNGSGLLHPNTLFRHLLTRSLGEGWERTSGS
jgi:hypothetical protein